MTKAVKSDIPLIVAKHLRYLDLGKKNYKRADAALDIVEQVLTPGEIVELPNGKKVRFKDKFDGRNKINVGLNARRYEFEEVTSP